MVKLLAYSNDNSKSAKVGKIKLLSMNNKLYKKVMEFFEYIVQQSFTVDAIHSKILYI